MAIVPFRDFILSWVVPKDREALNNFLALMELTKMLVAVVFVIALSFSLVQTDFLKMVRCMMFTAIAFIFIWFISTLQYLMAIEFNTRKGNEKK